MSVVSVMFHCCASRWNHAFKNQITALQTQAKDKHVRHYFRCVHAHVSFVFLTLKPEQRLAKHTHTYTHTHNKSFAFFGSRLGVSKPAAKGKLSTGLKTPINNNSTMTKQNVRINLPTTDSCQVCYRGNAALAPEPFPVSFSP